MFLIKKSKSKIADTPVKVSDTLVEWKFYAPEGSTSLIQQHSNNNTAHNTATQHT